MALLNGFKRAAAVSVIALGLVGASVAPAGAVTAPTPTTAIPTHQDIVAIDAKGDLVNFGAKGVTRKVIGRGWKGYSNLSVTDWDGDRVQDVVTLAPDGNLYLYRGNNKGGFNPRIKVLSGLKGSMVKVVRLVKDNISPQIMVRRPDGSLQIWLINKAGQVNSYYPLGKGYQSFTSMNVVDWDGGTGRDVMFVQTNGDVKILRTVAGQWYVIETPKLIGRGWTTAKYRQVQANGITAERSFTTVGGDGTLNLITLNKSGGFNAPKVIGRGWTKDYVLAGRD